MIPLSNSLSGLAPPALSLASTSGVVHGLSTHSDAPRARTPTNRDTMFTNNQDYSPISANGSSTREYEDAEQNVLHDLADHIVPSYLG